MNRAGPVLLERRMVVGSSVSTVLIEAVLRPRRVSVLHELDLFELRQDRRSSYDPDQGVGFSQLLGPGDAGYMHVAVQVDEPRTYTQILVSP